MTSQASKNIDINKLASGYSKSCLGYSVPYAMYNLMKIDKTFRYIASREKLDFDLNSVVRLMVCETLMRAEQENLLHKNSSEPFYKIKIDKTIIETTLSLIYKYKNTINKAVQNCIHNLGLEPKFNVAMLFLLNNKRINFPYLFVDDFYVSGPTKNATTYTGILTDLYNTPEKIIFSDDFVRSKRNLRKIKTLANNSNYDHICVIGSHTDFSWKSLSQLYKLNQTFCIQTLSNSPVFHKKTHDWIVENPFECEKMYDGYIKEKTLDCSLPNFDNKKNEVYRLKIVCFYSKNIYKLHKNYLNIDPCDRGWTCFLTNEELLSKQHIVHVWYSRFINSWVYNYYDFDFFGNPLGASNFETIQAYYTIFGISQACVNTLQCATGYPYDFAHLIYELRKYIVRLVDENLWMLDDACPLGDKLFSLIEKNPTKFMTSKEIDSYYYGLNLSKLKEKILWVSQELHKAILLDSYVNFL